MPESPQGKRRLGERACSNVSLPGKLRVRADLRGTAGRRSLGARSLLLSESLCEQGLQRHSGPASAVSYGARMRILITTDTVGGVWTFTQELAAGLLRSGCAVALVSLGRPPSDTQRSWCHGLTIVWGSSFHYEALDTPLE